MISINLITPDEPLFALSGLPFLLSWRPTAQRLQEPAVSLPVLARPRLEAKALPLEWLLDPEKDRDFPARVRARLIQLEAHEPDVWLRDDYRQAFITLHLALTGSPIPFIEASYQMYGLHPEKVWPAIIARRKALLGAEYAAVTGMSPDGASSGSSGIQRLTEPARNSFPPSGPPKKPVQSESDTGRAA